jgi:small ligand-binding sensory domain FIST
MLRPVTLLGSTAVSVIGGAHEAEETPAVSLWAAWGISSCVPVRLRLERTADGGGAITGLPAEAAEPGRSLIVVPEPFTFPADTFLDHLAATVPSLQVIGGLASASGAPGGNVLVLDADTFTDGGVGVLGDAGVETVVWEGCRPVGAPYTVTRAEGNLLAELGGRPALQRLGELAESLDPDDRQLLARGVHLGRVIDEHKVDFTRGDFLIRGVLGADRSGGALVVGDEVSIGDTVQFQVRDAASADEDLKALLAGREADGALVFTCNGRGSHLFDVPDHDASTVVNELGTAAVGGMFCAGELGPVGRRSFLHGFTASVALFRDAEGT